MARAYAYSFKNVIAAFGPHIASGFSKDSSISIEPLGDGATDEAGADGEVVVSISNDNRYSVKLKLQYGSQTNKFLHNKYLINQQSPGAGFFPVTVKDLGGVDILTLESAWVTKPASNTRGEKASDRDWEIHGVGGFTPV